MKPPVHIPVSNRPPEALLHLIVAFCEGYGEPAPLDEGSDLVGVTWDGDKWNTGEPRSVDAVVLTRQVTRCRFQGGYKVVEECGMLERFTIMRNGKNDQQG